MGNSFVSGSLIIALASILCTGFGVLLAHCFRLKYAQVSLCGMTFTRDIPGENEGLGIEMQRRVVDIIPAPTSNTPAPSRRGSMIV